MSRRTKPPLLRRSEMTGRVYIVTRYQGPNEDGDIIASEKYDVTADFLQLVYEVAPPSTGLLPCLSREAGDLYPCLLPSGHVGEHERDDAKYSRIASVDASPQ